MRLGVTLYIQNTLEAVDFYREAFGLTLGYFEKYPNGAYLHASLEKNGQEIISVSESSNEPFVKTMLASNIRTSRPTMSYGLVLDSAEDVARAFNLLSQGGTVMLPLGQLPWSAYCAEVVDRYGIYWYLTV